MNRILMIIVLGLPLACDPTAEPVKSQTPAGARAQPRTNATPDEDSAQITFRSLSECMVSCDQEHVIPTNRATCRLNCDSAYGAPETAVMPVAAVNEALAADPVGRAASCMEGCYAHSKVATEACMGACKGAVAGADNSPGMTVLDHLGGCIAACHDDRSLKSTNRATCELNCEQTARVAVR